MGVAPLLMPEVPGTAVLQEVRALGLYPSGEGIQGGEGLPEGLDTPC